jgi:hypothetical protein
MVENAKTMGRKPDPETAFAKTQFEIQNGNREKNQIRKSKK